MLKLLSLRKQLSCGATGRKLLEKLFSGAGGGSGCSALRDEFNTIVAVTAAF